MFVVYADGSCAASVGVRRELGLGSGVGAWVPGLGCRGFGAGASVLGLGACVLGVRLQEIADTSRAIACKESTSSTVRNRTSRRFTTWRGVRRARDVARSRGAPRLPRPRPSRAASTLPPGEAPHPGPSSRCSPRSSLNHTAKRHWRPVAASRATPLAGPHAHESQAPSPAPKPQPPTPSPLTRGHAHASNLPLANLPQPTKRVRQLHLPRCLAPHAEELWTCDNDRDALRSRERHVEPVLAVEKFHAARGVLR